MSDQYISINRPLKSVNFFRKTLQIDVNRILHIHLGQIQENVRQVSTSFWCLSCAHFSCVYIVDFEQVNVCLVWSCSVYFSIRLYKGLYWKNKISCYSFFCLFGYYNNNNDKIFVIKVWLKNRENLKNRLQCSSLWSRFICDILYEVTLVENYQCAKTKISKLFKWLVYLYWSYLFTDHYKWLFRGEI